MTREMGGGSAPLPGLILSPEKGYADRRHMRAYECDVTPQAHRAHDVGTKLDWIAIEHHNTDNSACTHPVPWARTSRVKT